MAWFKCSGGSGMPSGLLSDMNAVLNKKFGTTGQNYPPTGWPDDVNLMGPLEIKTVSGSIASFTDGADDVPVKSATFGIVASGGNGTPSTPIPIVGKSSVAVFQNGFNFFNKDTVITGNLNVSTGNVDTSQTSWRTSDYIRIKAGDFQFSWDSSSSYFQAKWVAYDENQSRIDGESITQSSTYSKTFTFPSGTVYVRIGYAITASGQAVTRENIRLNAGTTDLGYTAYKAKTPITVSLGQTVYGGILSEDGTLTLTYVKLNLWELPCTRLETSVSGKYRFALTTQDLSAPSTSVATTGLCNVAQSISADYLYGAHDGIAVRNSTTIHMYDENYATDTAINFKAHLQEIGAVAVLPLRTSAYTVITGLDEIIMNTYLGDNSIWCDSGDSEVVYRSSGTETIITPTLVSKTITENGTYSAEDDGADGYDEVTVDVPTFLVNDTDLKTSGQMLYSKTVTIAEAGDYQVIWQSYSGAPTIQVNGVTQSMTYSNGSRYAYYYCATHTLAVGDTVSFYLNDTGNNCFVAQIMKVQQSQNRSVPIEEQEETETNEER